jgi:hypothetical protein
VEHREDADTPRLFAVVDAVRKLRDHALPHVAHHDGMDSRIRGNPIQDVLNAVGELLAPPRSLALVEVVGLVELLPGGREEP